jgi:CDP-glucose 4,6-dehydratase
MFDTFSGKRVFLTGDTGFKGSWLGLWLTELGADVTGLALPAEPTSVLACALRKSNVFPHVDADIRDPEPLRRAMADVEPDFVFHLAAQALLRRSYAQPQETFATNLLGSVNVLEAVRATPGVRALIFVTSDKCYLNREIHRGYVEEDELGGRDPYSASKACAEIAFRAYNESFLVGGGVAAGSVRAGNVIGGGDRSQDRIVPDTITALEAGKPIILRNPDATRPWQHVLDPLCGYLQLALGLMRNPVEFSGPWNFGPDEKAVRTVKDLAGAIVAAWGSGSIECQLDPKAPHEATLLHLSSAKAQRLLGWRPLWAFDRSALETTRWYRAVKDGADPLAITRAQIADYSRELAAA